MLKPNPPRHSLFAFWNWPKRVWAILIPLTPVAYFLSAAPVAHFVRHYRLQRGIPGSIIMTVYKPVVWLMEHSELARTFFQSQRDFLERLFGPP